MCSGMNTGPQTQPHAGEHELVESKKRKEPEKVISAVELYESEVDTRPSGLNKRQHVENTPSKISRNSDTLAVSDGHNSCQRFSTQKNGAKHLFANEITFSGEPMVLTPGTRTPSRRVSTRRGGHGLDLSSLPGYHFTRPQVHLGEDASSPVPSSSAKRKRKLSATPARSLSNKDVSRTSMIYDRSPIWTSSFEDSKESSVEIGRNSLLRRRLSNTSVYRPSRFGVSTREDSPYRRSRNFLSHQHSSMQGDMTFPGLAHERKSLGWIAGEDRKAVSNKEFDLLLPESIANQTKESSNQVIATITGSQTAAETSGSTVPESRGIENNSSISLGKDAGKMVDKKEGVNVLPSGEIAGQENHSAQPKRQEKGSEANFQFSSEKSTLGMKTSEVPTFKFGAGSSGDSQQHSISTFTFGQTISNPNASKPVNVSEIPASVKATQFAFGASGSPAMTGTVPDNTTGQPFTFGGPGGFAVGSSGKSSSRGSNRRPARRVRR